MNIKIHTIKNKAEELKLAYSINGSKRSLTSDQKLSEGFIKSLKDLVPVTLTACDLKDDAKNYELTSLSIQRKDTEEGENRSCVISIKKSVAWGTLNISTPKIWLECDKDDAIVLDDISQNLIRDACSNAAVFIKADSINRELYSQAELDLKSDGAMESAGKAALAH